MQKIELYIKNANGENKTLIGTFESKDAIAAYMGKLYNIVTVNDNQHLLIVNKYMEDSTEVLNRYFIGCFESQESLQTFLNGCHEIIEKDNDELKNLIHDKIVELENLEN